MKTSPVSLSLLLVSALAAFAQETPAPPIPPAPPVPPVEATPRIHTSGKITVSSGFGDRRTVKVLDLNGEQSPDSPMSLKFRHAGSGDATGPVTFMGVSVASAPQDLAAHLPLDKGVGLIVENVSAASPAEKAGLQTNDILTKFDDQLLIHPSQFAVLVARKKEGDSVKLSLLRKGAAQEIPVTLGKNEGGDIAGGSGTLKIGDMEIQIDGADTAPLRTFVKRLKMDGPAGAAMVQIEGDNLKIDGDQIKAMSEATLKKLQAQLAGEGGKLDGQMEAVKAAALMALEQAKAAAGAAGAELKDKAKEEAVRQLEEALRSVKEQ